MLILRWCSNRPMVYTEFIKIDWKLSKHLNYYRRRLMFIYWIEFCSIILTNRIGLDHNPWIRSLTFFFRNFQWTNGCLNNLENFIKFEKFNHRSCLYLFRRNINSNSKLKKLDCNSTLSADQAPFPI